MFVWAGLSLLPAESSARTTTRYWPRGNLPRSVRCQLEVPCARNRTARRHERHPPSPAPWLVRKRHVPPRRARAIETYTRVSRAQPGSVERPFIDIDRRPRRMSRRRSVDLGGCLSRHFGGGGGPLPLPAGGVTPPGVVSGGPPGEPPGLPAGP